MIGDDPVIDQKWAYSLPHLYRGMARLYLGEWEGAKSDLVIAKEMRENIIALFNEAYESVSDFEGKHDIQLPPDITAMLTPQ